VEDANYEAEEEDSDNTDESNHEDGKPKQNIADQDQKQAEETDHENIFHLDPKNNAEHEEEQMKHHDNKPQTVLTVEPNEECFRNYNNQTDAVAAPEWNYGLEESAWEQSTVNTDSLDLSKPKDGM
jgi:hypothetical protein